MTNLTNVVRATVAGVALCLSLPAWSADDIKIGFPGPVSGPVSRSSSSTRSRSAPVSAQFVF